MCRRYTSLTSPGMDGICKLGDFGLMLDLAAAERTGMEGDPKYLAPEVVILHSS